MATSTSTTEPDKSHIQALEERLAATEEKVESLQREKAFSQRLVEMAQTIILLLDPQGRIVWFNPHFSEITGHSLHEVIGKDWFSIFRLPEDLEPARQRFEKIMSGNSMGHNFSEILTKSGRIKNIEWHNVVIQESGTAQLLCVGHDITEKCQIEDALVWQSQLNAALAELSTALIHPAAMDDIPALVLGHACRLTQSPIGFVGYVDDQTGCLICPAVLLRDSENGQNPKRPMVFSLTDGLRGKIFQRREPIITNTATIELNLGPVPSWHPKIERFLCVPAILEESLVGQIALANSYRDYTQKDLHAVSRMALLYALALRHQQMYHTIEASEERFRTIFRESPVGIRLYDADGFFIDANPACLDIFDMEDAACLKGSNLFNHPKITKADLKKLETGVPVRFEQEYYINDMYKGHIAPSAKAETLYLDVTICRLGVRGPSPFQGYLSMTHDITQKKKTELALRESEKKLRHLSSSLLKAQELERQRISYGLHDELGQSLAALKMQIGIALGRFHSSGEQLAPECEAVLEQLDAIIENTRRLSRGLSPTVLDNLGLTAAIRWLVKDFAEHHGIVVALDLPVIDHLFPRESEIIIYRIIQESFTNVVKHAQATQVDLSVRRHRNRVRFYIVDNGVGFDMTEVSQRRWPEKGLGLTAMDERARILGCPLRRLSRKGQGTRITFSVQTDGTIEAR